MAGSYGLPKLGNASTERIFNGSIVSNYSYNPDAAKLVEHVNEYLALSSFKQYPNKGYGEIMANEIAKDMQARGANVEAVKGKAMLRAGDSSLVALLLSTKDLKWRAKESKAYRSILKESKGSIWIDAINKQKQYYKKK